ncbi:MAG: helix-turn-helix domain-containing protein [Pseudonocardia sp.]
MRDGTTIRRRQLARKLRKLRQKAGLTLETAAPLLDWSPSKLSRIENAHQRVDVHSVRGMLDLYDVGGDRWTELIDLTRAARQRGWWRDHGLDDRGYIPLEAEATTVRDYSIAHVPDLLRTAEYTRELLGSSLRRRSTETLERTVTVQRIRQERLTSDEQPLHLMTIVEESALHRPCGGPKIMKAQLRRIIETAALDSVTFQVLPTSAEAHPGRNSAFTLLSFDELAEPDIAYVEHLLGSATIENEADVATARLVFDHLRSQALSPADSIDLVEQVATQLHVSRP